MALRLPIIARHATIQCLFVSKTVSTICRHDIGRIKCNLLETDIENLLYKFKFVVGRNNAALHSDTTLSDSTINTAITRHTAVRDDSVRFSFLNSSFTLNFFFLLQISELTLGIVYGLFPCEIKKHSLRPITTIFQLA